jgi:tetratricopeptide (TPR) repeat protein
MCNISFGQKVNQQIINGNEAYNKNQFDSAASSYQKALQKAPQNNIAAYNLGNALYKTNKPEEAVKYYDNAIATSKGRDAKESGFYNKGVALQKQNKLPECINAYKNALKIAPQDEDARQNLQRALQQLKQQQQKPQQQKDQKDKKQDQKEQQKQEPKPQPSKITKEDAEEKLKSLAEQEKNLQEKLRKVKAAAPEQPKKDW